MHTSLKTIYYDENSYNRLSKLCIARDKSESSKINKSSNKGGGVAKILEKRDWMIRKFSKSSTAILVDFFEFIEYLSRMRENPINRFTSMLARVSNYGDKFVNLLES